MTPAAAAAAVAAAQPVTQVAYQGEVQLVGDQILFSEGGVGIYSVSPGGVPMRIFTGPGLSTFSPPPFDYVFTINELRFAASPTLLAAEQYSDRVYRADDNVSDSLQIGPLAGPFSGVSSPRSCYTQRQVFAVSGSTLAYLSCTTSPNGEPGAGSIVLHDTSASGQTDRTLTVPAGISPAGGDALTFAGDGLAAYFPPSTSAPGEIVVWNVATGAVAYTLPIAGTPAGSTARGLSLAVQSNQTVAFFEPATGGCGVVAWASVAEPSQHDVPGCASGGVRLVADRLAYVAGPSGAGALVTADLDGANRRTAVDLGGVPLVDFAFDGIRLVSEIPTCEGGAAYAVEDASANEPATVNPVCPGTIPIQQPALQKATVNIAVACPLGCNGEVTARTVDGITGAAPVHVPAGHGTGVVNVALSKYLRPHGISAIKLSLSRLVSDLDRLAHDGTVPMQTTFSPDRLDSSTAGGYPGVGGTTPTTRALVLHLPAAVVQAFVEGLTTHTARLGFKLIAGLPGGPAKTFGLTLPRGLAFASSSRALDRGIVITSDSGRRLGFTARVNRGRLAVKLTPASPSVRIAITAPALTVGRTLERAIRSGQRRQLEIIVSETGLGHRAARFKLLLRVS